MRPLFVAGLVLALTAAAASAQTPPPNSQQPKPELVVQAGHSYIVTSVAFSPDGRMLASGSWDKTVKLWDVATGQELRTLASHTLQIACVAFNSDGRTLASGSDDKTVKLWDVATGKELRTMAGHTSTVYSVAFSPDGRTVASGSGDKTIKMWDAATGQLLRTLAGHTHSVGAVAFNPDGRTLASASGDNEVKLWDVATGEELRTLTGLLSVAFSPDGRTLASGSFDKTVKLLDVATGRQLRTLVGHTDWVRSIAFSPDGRTLASASDDKTLKLWDVATGRQLRTLTGHFDSVNSVAFSGSGGMMASGGGLSVKLWDPATGRELRSLAGGRGWIYSGALSPDGRILASGLWDNTVKLWDLSAAHELRTLTGHTKDVLTVAFSPDGRTLASGDGIGAVKLWDVSAGRELRTLTGPAEPVDSVAFSPDGHVLASGSRDRTVRLWDPATGQVLRTLTGHTANVQSVAFSPNGRTLASGSHDKTVKLWDVATGRELRTMSGHTDAVASIAFSPDGRILASGSADKTLKLWDVATGQELRTLAGHSAWVMSIAFSPDGRTLASGSSDNTIKLWDFSAGQELRTLTGHSNSVPFVAFGPGGRMLTSGSWDASMRIWDLSTGKQLARLVALDKEDWAVVDSDGRFDASRGGIEFMHWVVGLEPIALDQLKQRYYEPGLLPKVLGFNKEPPRDVSAFTSVALVPEVETLGPVDENGKLRIKLKNRGGGIGRVQVFVNGKELLADARGPKFDPAAQEATLTIDLRGGPIMRGKENKISVVAWNQEGYLRSRDDGNLGWKPPGQADDRDPELYAIVVGTSKYRAENLQLNFAAKDAEDMARAFELAGKRLFGADHVHLSLFSTSGKPGVPPPTKANLKRAFEQAQTGGPNDVLLVYLAGHGTTQKDLYVYLTQDSTGRDLYDPAILEQTTITSDELAEWIKKVPARHQVLILDTCGAGAVATKLLEKRDIPSDQIRALDTLKDRTGFHVLMGSAADAVSYEASQYGQGLLTYTLLQGMRGAALKDDTEVDVSKLFRYAEDRVPEMARNIGGIQKPQVIEPRVGQSFPVGMLLAQDKKDIPLALVKPLLLRPVALNPKDVGDTLHLQDALRKRLREENYVSTRGGEPRQPAAVFVDEEEFPGAFQPKALYTVEGKQVHLTLVLWRDGQKEATLQEDGSTDNLPGFVEKIAQDIIQTVRRAQPPPPSPS